jgi:hypothetical protein
MKTMFFGQYLLAKGVIDREALLDALERQRKYNLSLPELAVRQGLIEPEDAAEVLSRFRMSVATIDEILIEGGYLDAEGVHRLHRTQRTSWLRIGSALVEGGHLTEDAIAEHLAEFRSLESAADHRIRNAMRDIPHSDAVGACVEVTVFHFSRVTGRPAKLEAVGIAPQELDAGWQRFSQRIMGDGDFTIAVDLPAELVTSVARGMLGDGVEAESDAEADAVCEFINLIGGNACTRIEQLGYRLRPEPPVWSGSGEVVAPAEESVQATVVSADIEFKIRVFTENEGAR